MFAVIFHVVVIIAVMWVFFKFMYPKPPTAFLPKKDDDVSLRVCDYCGHSLATYRGILQDDGKFFCNDEHKNSYSVASQSVPSKRLDYHQKHDGN